MNNQVNYYDVLGVDMNATKNQILLKGENLIHYIENDDAFDMSEEEKEKYIRNIEKAVAILSNDELRAKHDKYLQKLANNRASYMDLGKAEEIKKESDRKLSELKEDIDSKIDELSRSIDEEYNDDVEENKEDTIEEVIEDDDVIVENTNDDEMIVSDPDLDEYGNNKWSPKDIFILTESYGFYTDEYIAELLDKDVHDIEMMASQLNLNKNRAKEDYEKIVNVEEGQKQANNGRKALSPLAIQIITSAIILGVGITAAAIIINRTKGDENTPKTEIAVDNGEVIEEIEPVATKPKEEEVLPEETNTVEEQTTTENEEVEVVEEVEPKNEPAQRNEETINESSSSSNTATTQEEVVEVNSREQLVNSIKEKINNLQNKNLVTDVDTDLIIALIGYANGEKTISNSYAYEKFQELLKAGFDISEFYKNTDSYKNINDLYSKLASVIEDRGKYDDEYNAYQQIRTSVNNLKNNYFPEAIALSAMIDYKINLNSMVIARGGANDGVSVAEAGIDYKNEIDAAASHASECLNIFNEVDIYNSNSAFTQIICKAVEEDEARSLSKTN